MVDGNVVLGLCYMGEGVYIGYLLLVISLASHRLKMKRLLLQLKKIINDIVRLDRGDNQNILTSA